MPHHSDLIKLALDGTRDHHKEICEAFDAANPDEDGSLFAELDKRGAGDAMRETIDRIKHHHHARRGRSKYVQGWRAIS